MDMYHLLLSIHKSICLSFSPVIPTQVVGIVSMVIFTVALFVQARQQEWTNRLDFLWKTQVNLHVYFISIFVIQE